MAVKHKYKAGWLKKMGVAVHTGSRVGNDPKFANNAALLGKLLPTTGFKNIYYGDGDAGTMGVIARSAIRYGADVTGVSLDFFHAAQGEGLPGAKASIAVPDMHKRMRIMRDNAGANVVAPGSYGTMEEALEWLVANNGIIKPQIWQSLDGHWNGLNSFLDKMIKTGVEKPTLRDRFCIVGSPNEAMRKLRFYNNRRPQYDNNPVQDHADDNYITKTEHALIVEPAPLSVISRLISQIVTYDVSNIEGQTLFTDPDNIIRPVIFIGDYYEGLQEQVYHVIGTGFSPDERRQFFHFVDTRHDAEILAHELDSEEPLRPENLKKKHQEGLSREDQQLTHPTLESLLPDSLA